MKSKAKITRYRGVTIAEVSVPRFEVRPGFSSELGDEMPRNEIANLLENSVMSTGWTFLCFHTRRVAVNEESIQPFFCPAVGWL